MMKTLLFLLALLTISISSAREMNYLARSPRALLMGDAYTAIADDEFTLFYNPAALARNKGVSFTLLDPQMGFTDALSELDRFQNFPSSATGIARRSRTWRRSVQTLRSFRRSRAKASKRRERSWRHN